MKMFNCVGMLGVLLGFGLLTGEASFGRERVFSLDGKWNTSSVQCIKNGRSSPPSYEAQVSLNVKGTTYSGTGSVAGFSCQISGTVSKRGALARFQIINDGGCALSEYLGGGFTGKLQGNSMEVLLGSKISAALCSDEGSTVKVRLRRAR